MLRGKKLHFRSHSAPSITPMVHWVLSLPLVLRVSQEDPLDGCGPSGSAPFGWPLTVPLFIFTDLPQIACLLLAFLHYQNYCLACTSLFISTSFVAAVFFFLEPFKPPLCLGFLLHFMLYSADTFTMFISMHTIKVFIKLQPTVVSQHIFITGPLFIGIRVFPWQCSLGGM